MELRVRDLPDDLHDDLNDDDRDVTSEPSDTPPPLTRVLAALGERVGPVAMAGERILPVSEDLQRLFPEGGLVRGRVMSCVGSGATSVALSAVATAAVGGSWVAIIDVPTVGLDAASELGVPLERVVAIDTTKPAITESGGPSNSSSWADVVAAAADGFELLIVSVPADVRASTLRKVSTRLQQRGVVMLVLGDPGPLVCDGVLAAAHQTWSGIGHGWGHLAHRTVEVEATGRRIPGRRCVSLAFTGGPATVSPDSDTASDAEVAELSNAS